MNKRAGKLPAADRKDAILAAAIPVFARLGRSATTKEIAKAAGVSEALLYKHFPGKEALYAELESHCVEANAIGGRLLEGATPSTATLVTGVAVLVQAVFPGVGAQQSHENTKRLVTLSLLNDGRFAKAFLDRHVKPWIGVFDLSLRAAAAAGDMHEGVPVGAPEIWFVHHLANTLHLISLPGAGVVDYGVSQDELVRITVRFLLRGLGLKHEAIERHYDPDAIEAIFTSTSGPAHATH
ncbi:TetR/AcrR family transcriptional regulator [Dyella sp.]|uniref:TetR/AcrR family transcriptional regulator n=1 Tax=Dyella sp. TaxID=1869338 RepID=UPI002ED10D6E